MGSALEARAYFLFDGKKKVAKEKATPGSAPLRGSLRYSALAWAAELGAAPLKQSSPFFRQRLRCSAPLKGARTTSRLNRLATVVACCGRQPKKGKNQNGTLVAPDGLPGPLRGAEQRRNAGGSRRGLSEGRSPEFRSRPAFRVAQGTGAAGNDPGSPSSLLTFFLATQEESMPARQARKTADQKARKLEESTKC
jgi:hypothetical protein